MAEVVERSYLLALMRRLRRRRRWMAALEGGAVAVAIAAGAMAVVVACVRLSGVAGLDGRWIAVGLGLALALGAGARAARRISLDSCARAVDRLLAAQRTHPGKATDDCVLAAVSLAGTVAAPTPFVAALTTAAALRARTVSPRMVVPPPAWQKLAGCAAGVGALVAATLLPPAASRAAMQTGAVFPAAHSGKIEKGPVPLPALELETEREEAALAAETARTARDAQLARVADELRRVVDELAEGGLDGAAAVNRLEALAQETGTAAELASRARAGAAAAERTLRSARGVGDEGKALADALSRQERQERQERQGGQESVATASAAALASRGAAGRAALAGAATAAAAAAAVAATTAASRAAASGGPTSSAESARRLNRPDEEAAAAASGAEQSPRAGSRGEGEGEQGGRRLEQLRRDLDQGAAACRQGDEDCRSSVEAMARTLSQLKREGAQADGRERVAQAARHLLDRLRRQGRGEGDGRGEPGGGAADRMRRFGQAARGQGSMGGGHPQRGENRAGSSVGGGESAGDGRGSQAGQTPSGQDSDGTGQGATPQEGAAPGGGSAAAPGPGIGSEPGGPVLGPVGAQGPGVASRAGRATTVPLADSGAGPSRAETIAGAATSGFSTRDYRRVYEDYRTAIEQSLETTAVPPGQRTLVRRYFQLIRPRSAQ